ncbi:acyl carrier protein [Bradyrhizobium elkanii]|uniref:phosphopantetheine-binding protein n=1 Tax=Bradyrhizobium elkanii TaxID=29448 RepID=UPI001FDA8A4E|nr:phosphopantetheine-binding protein [Bradyrhizobium elkanii]MCP1966940.1 acyl carrier protein [Bradyrhizobium elkanii]MCS3523109.1 acyl carrier protein [Bradyrhizobium elkanii]MCS4070762.1 acyl carrier protein [Bradyrhizobium elkanii]MCS4077393.1 acyl carrier protein [Bradyrhizobium elkanii]MCS4111554.1 acyl carrier protein [Bradyrhizobium elkanii]
MELRQFLQRELASFKIPLLILDQLPKEDTGKIQRRQLRELFDGRSGQQVSMRVPRAAKGPLDLEAELLMLWRRLLKSDAVTLDDDFFACGGDSLLAMEMLLQLEQLIGKAVPETILFGAETIRQLAQKLETETDAPPTPIAQFHTGGHRPPLYFFNGDLRNGHTGLRRMVELLRSDYRCSTLVRHRASKVFWRDGVHSSEPIGSLGFSMSALASSSVGRACVEIRTGHSNNDFESMGLPSYQHFRPSMRRQDQYSRGFGGITALHCCFACAVGIPINRKVAMRAAKGINENCLFIGTLRDYFVAAVDLQQRPSRAAQEPQLTCRVCVHCRGGGAEDTRPICTGLR